MATPHTLTTTFWDHATIWDLDDESLAGHTTDGGRVFGITRTRYVECDHYKCPPVAVIAYEDEEQVERFREMASRWADDVPYDAKLGGLTHLRAMQAALEEYANPILPKPGEPTGLGAVIEDASGAQWVRWSAVPERPWLRVTPGGCTTAYVDIAAVRVLSEGVRP